MKEVIIYTDGACSYNPGPGGWGAILMFGGQKKEISGGDEMTTNNQMELLAVIKALSALKEPCKVEIFTDSAYVCNAFQQDWISGWIMRGWKNANKKPVANRELWEELIALTQKHIVHFNKVKGHADNEFNNRCDLLARMEVEKILAKRDADLAD
ncbi:MAG: ribonuclease HI [Clostridia bacterium]|nr:ribonuclease HI [Clostridia bacterium]